MEGEGKCEWELHPVCVGGDGWLGLVIGVRERSSNIGRYEHRYIVCSEPKQKASAIVIRKRDKNMRSPPHRSIHISVYSTWPSVAMSNKERIKSLALCFGSGLDYFNT